MVEHHDRLGEFLRSRRAALTPDAAGVVSSGMRRVAGLRREELAERAGLSVAYYARLEQGTALNASDSVLDALSRALMLDHVERAHLFTLARTADLTPAAEEPYVARASTLALLDAMSDVPALLLARNQDVLAWNRLGHALLASHLSPSAPTSTPPPNVTRMLFLDPDVRTLYQNWAHEASLAVASLRFVVGRFSVDDGRLRATIAGLCRDSAEFDALWREQPIELCVSGTKRLQHPRVGEMSVEFEMLHLAEATGQRLLTFTARPGTADADALRVLASTTLT